MISRVSIGGDDNGGDDNSYGGDDNSYGGDEDEGGDPCTGDDCPTCPDGSAVACCDWDDEDCEDGDAAWCCDSYNLMCADTSAYANSNDAITCDEWFGAFDTNSDNQDDDTGNACASVTLTMEGWYGSWYGTLMNFYKQEGVDSETHVAGRTWPSARRAPTEPGVSSTRVEEAPSKRSDL